MIEPDTKTRSFAQIDFLVSQRAVGAKAWLLHAVCTIGRRQEFA